MKDIAIRAQHLGKRYQIGGASHRATSLPEAVAHAVRRPFTALREWRNSGSEDFWALNDVSFEIHAGEVIGVVGRNGAGKSTLLKILSQITAPTSGSVDLYGRVASLLEVGTGFHPELSGRENVFLNGAILGMPREEIQRKFDDIVEFAGVQRFLDTPVKRYSSGMYVRLAFAVAAHLQPEILLVDEVLAVGDVEFQKKCIGRMEKVAHEGRTVLVVSHSMSTVRALCSRALLLEGGAVKMFGPAATVVDEYLKANRVDSAQKQIEPTDYTSNSGELQVEQIRLCNAVADSFTVHWRQPIDVELTIRVTEPLEAVSFGAGIRMVDGTHLFHVHQVDEGAAPLWSFEPGRYDIRFSLDNPLRPGIYKLHVGADRGNLMLRGLFGLDAITLEVLDHAASGAVPLASNTGVINGKSHWDPPVRRANAGLPGLTVTEAASRH